MLLTFAIGDIHGSLSKLRDLVARCVQYAGGRDSTLVFLGDYLDRGPDSAGVIRYVTGLQSQPRGKVIALRGNHESIALGVIDGAIPPDYWNMQGGAATLASYGVAQAGDLPAADIDWLRALPVSYDDGRRFFVHAGIDPLKPYTEQDERDLIWIREPFLSDRRDYGRLIVHGHTPSENGRPELRSNRVNVDTGAVFGGPLTAAVFDDATVAPVDFLRAD